MTAVAPIARFALAYGGGVAAGLLSVPTWVTLLALLLWLAAPERTSQRPFRIRGALTLLVGAGLLAGYAAGAPGAVPHPPSCASDSVVVGRLLAPMLAGSAPLDRGAACGVITVVAPRGGPGAELRPGAGGAVPGSWSVPAGVPVRVRGTMREGRTRPWFAATEFEVDRTRRNVGVVEALRWHTVRIRGGVVERIHDLYGSRAPLVAALTLARTEGLDRDIRDTFAQAGIAHLLAISGFHVGIVAGLVSALLARLPWPRRRKRLVAAIVTMAYVALIGVPVSAGRAALIFVLTAASASMGRPPSRWGALGASGLILLLIDPADLARPGFQLSFAGAAGLVAWHRPLDEAFVRLGRRQGQVVPRTVSSGLAAGVAATVATLPIVAWHFERVALLGIPATLIATPLVSLALPGAVASVVLHEIWAPLGLFLAGGVSGLLEGLSGLSRVIAAAPMANAWVARPAVLAALAGVLGATWVARHPAVDGRRRRRLTVVLAAVGLTAWPTLVALQGRGAMELWMLDVGQGDALAIRTPAGGWLLVDAGPPSDGPAAAQPVVRALRRLGVRSIDLLVLTHPDADHIGGAAAVLQSVAVARVLDPALPVPKPGYVEVIDEARARSIPWQAARAGQRFVVDEVALEVLHPSDSSIARQREAGALAEANAVSVVLLVSWRGVELLLTGDAYVDVEGLVMDRVGDIEILKVGHHGSRTSTSLELLRATTPEHALISVGRFNRYGHPAPEVVRRLHDAGARIHRTDRDGTVRIRIDRGGGIRVEARRSSLAGPRPARQLASESDIQRSRRDE